MALEGGDDIMTGERIQELADVYLGYPEDFDYNPRIRHQSSKHRSLHDIVEAYDNPSVVFCYTHRVEDFYSRLGFFQNEFVLITHNSDGNIDKFHPLLESPMLLRWYAQNVGFSHPKLVFLPIGIANEQWAHGSEFFRFYDQTNTNNIEKTGDVYLQFSLSTNESKRRQCHDVLTAQKGVPFLSPMTPFDNLRRLATYRYCVCPEGNGLDTHRLYEALLCGCVPIVLDTPFVRVLRHHYPSLPLLVLSSWDEFDPGNFPDHSTFDFSTCHSLLSLSALQKSIRVKTPSVVLVSVGVFQEYLLDNVAQLLHLGHEGHVYVITNTRFFPKLERFHGQIHIVCAEDLVKMDEHDMNGHNRLQLDRSFRDGFWCLTSSRFFYLYYAMRTLHLEHVFHLENDVLIYYHCDKVLRGLDTRFLHMPFDTFQRNIASVVYVPSHDILRRVLEHYDFSANDMYNFSRIRSDTGLVRGLPIFPTCKENEERAFVSENYQGIIFDAAAMGQYLSGIDPRNCPGDTRGFVNETCIIKYDEYEFEWRDHKPFLRVSPSQECVPIFNLHIHCKDLSRFMLPVELDVVIPLGPHDTGVLHRQLEYTRKNIVGLRTLYVVSCITGLDLGPGVVIVDEAAFPFCVQDVDRFIHTPPRNGWYLQQLIKLYAWEAIPALSPRYLVLDADTFFLRPTRFVDGSDRSLYATSHEYHVPYFDHMRRISHGKLDRADARSGIVHHMVMEKKYLQELFDLVSPDRPFWESFLEGVAVEHRAASASGASEFEIYFHFMLRYHPEEIRVRDLCWKNVRSLGESSGNEDFVSNHWHSR